MSLNPEDLAPVLADLRSSIEADIAADSNAPAETLALFRLHWDKPWVPNFMTSLVSPLRPTMRAYLKLSVFRADGRIWYIPSAAWWRAHARDAHGPSGKGCDVQKHVAMLTEEAEKPMFLYADVLNDGRRRVLGEDDFKIEAGYWMSHFTTASAVGEDPVTSDE